MSLKQGRLAVSQLGDMNLIFRPTLCVLASPNRVIFSICYQLRATCSLVAAQCFIYQFEASAGETRYTFYLN